MSTWISVKDRLPEPGVYVLVLEESQKYSSVRRLSEDRTRWENGGLGIGWTTHWMPLPDRPEETVDGGVVGAITYDPAFDSFLRATRADMDRLFTDEEIAVALLAWIGALRYGASLAKQERDSWSQETWQADRIAKVIEKAALSSLTAWEGGGHVFPTQGNGDKK